MKLCLHAAGTKIPCRGNYCFPPRETFGNISSSKRVTDSSRLNTEVSNVRSGCSGASKGAETPVKSLIAPACLRIQPFDIAPLALFDRSADIYFQEVLLPDNRCRHFPQIVIRADKSRYRDNSRIDKKFAYFGDTADILYPVFSRKAEIVVDPAADIVAVQDAAQQTALVQFALKRYRHRALPGTAQPGKPSLSSLVIILSKIG